jgi:hypothetical protein
VPRRGHGVEVIAVALAQRLAGAGPRLIGQRLGVAADTVRGWVRRVVRRADQLRGAATGHLHLLDPVAVPPESPEAISVTPSRPWPRRRRPLRGAWARLEPGRDGRCSGGSG